MPARFDDSLPFSGTAVIAMGPLHPSEGIKEICAWVFQPSDGHHRDAAATEMTTLNRQPFQQVEGVRWLLSLRQVSGADLHAGRAFAVAVALLYELGSPAKERVVWWGQPVDLFASRDDVAAAQQPGALERPPLNAPAPSPPPHPAAATSG
jgi:hypothetical protein